MVIERFVATARENACGVHGPFPRAEATAAIIEIAGRYPGEIALTLDDPLLGVLDLDAALGASAARVLTPAHADWTTRLPTAAVGITGSLLAVAATGTVVLGTNAGAPRATSLLPPVHICVIDAATVVGEFADAIARLDAGTLPSALTWIGGPSRTSDLEMRPTIGIHGPKTVELVLVQSDAPVASHS
jgi:L-lactate dehydrogenase complex protein LldG